MLGREPAQTFGFPRELRNFLGAWHEFGIYVELATSSGYKMAVLRGGTDQNRAYGHERGLLESQSLE
jgi:hypothetical protein